ncbi:MAG TPA: protoporphyrinogen oxidase [Balneola sp.]|jgi:protoporphyrinogen/coproporphyrinogen III oxidase|nr:protoporphyrinogen oxidase [Balneola sp.]MAO77879.1 protoporphyrinogen oxidase [Balneola sp.]MBF63333.1 protoporphyrinogen oxidase [Balneola sp.]HBZ39301.1 protoporphyrinogen oxidase [Balneola sp.]|tara:strand:- start:1889 stop:3226 length:1338 start_codon:yes stop_codon:yes gene_type:complete
MSTSSSNTIAVLGGGISGLSTAWYLKKKGFEVTLFEAQEDTGGVIRSVSNQYSVFDFGPNTIRDKTGSVSEMITDLGLEDEVLSMSEGSKTRFIVKNGELKKIKQNPISFLFSDVLSWKGKKKLFSEPLKKSLNSDADESIGSFLERRIGKEAVEYLADPFFSGIYAGDIYSLSKNKLIGKLADFEQDYGSIVKGFLKSRKEKSSFKPKVISFKMGVQQLTDKLTERLQDSILHEEVKSLQVQQSNFKVTTADHEYIFDKVVSCLPAYVLKEVLKTDNQKLENSLSEINYSPMLSTQLVFKKEDLNLPENGFGFLVPRKENTRLLGAIWKSNIFPDQTEDEYVHVNLMTGGSHDIKVIDQDIRVIEKEVIEEFSTIMNVKGGAEMVSSKLWKKAIPQFHVDFASVEDSMNRFQKENEGFYIGGNFRWGVSVSDCVDGAKNLSEFI